MISSPSGRVAGSRPSVAEPPTHAADLLAAARAEEQGGWVESAMDHYASAIDASETSGQARVLAEALRRLSVLHHHRNESAEARERCQRSYDVAHAAGEPILAAEALNTFAGFEFERGSIEAARATFDRALVLGGASPLLRARIEQNLGILANMQGDLVAALRHYQASLEGYASAADDNGCAIAYHNLGMISADERRWPDAERYFTQSYAIACRIGNVHLQGLCLLNHAEVYLAGESFEAALESAERALEIFDRLGSSVDKVDAYRIIGMVYRDSGRPTLSEHRLRTAMELAAGTGSILSEAEAARELARLYQDLGRNQEALTLLNSAHRLFHRLDARVDLVDVASKAAELERTYLAVVRDWGQSIESADSYTFGHCERVAGYAHQVALALGLGDSEVTTIRLGAYLHDLGKVRVPHEILNKAGPLAKEEFEVMKQHPVWGLAMLAAIEFPWDIKPIIRWHHEKYDGSGYPDRLAGDAIPVSAQVICIVDVYDALTTTRSYRAAMTREQALETMRESRRWWRPDVFDAFMGSVGALAQAA